MQYVMNYTPEGSKRGWARSLNLSVDDVKNIQSMIIFDTLKLSINEFIWD